MNYFTFCKKVLDMNWFVFVSFYLDKTKAKGCVVLKQIGFVGIDSTDIVLYLARLLSGNEKKVAIVDYTKRHQLIQTANVPDVLFGSGSYYKEILVVAADSLTDDKEVRGCEYIFHYFGAVMTHPQIANCTELYMVTDMALSNATMFKGMTCSEITKKRCIVRNVIDVKYKIKFLIDAMEQSIPMSEVAEIPYREEDYRSKCYLCIDSRQKSKIKELSADMQQVLFAIVRGWEELTDKQLKKIVKKA